MANGYLKRVESSCGKHNQRSRSWLVWIAVGIGFVIAGSWFEGRSGVGCTRPACVRLLNLKPSEGRFQKPDVGVLVVAVPDVAKYEFRPKTKIADMIEPIPAGLGYALP